MQPDSVATVGYELDLSVYSDTGCPVAPSCLACPFAMCRYDSWPRFQIAETVSRAAEVMELRLTGMTHGRIATQVGISLRTVNRYIALATAQDGGTAQC